MINITLAKAIDEYINALGDHFEYSKISWLCLIQEFSIAQDFITKNTSADMTQHAQLSNQKDKERVGFPLKGYSLEVGHL